MPSLLDKRRMVAAFVAVTMSAALIAFSFIVSDSFQSQITANARASVGGADLVVLPAKDQDLPADLDQALAAAPGVASARPYIEGHAYIDHPGEVNDSHAFVLDVPAPSTTMVSGRLPQQPGEVAVSETLAQQQNLGVGDALPLHPTVDLRAQEGGPSLTAVITGILRPTAAMTRSSVHEHYVFATRADQEALGMSSAPAAVYVAGADGAPTDSLRQTVQQVAPGAQVWPASEIISMRAASANSGNVTILTLLNTLAPVCAVVAAIIIGATFTTLVAHQARQIGLLRCVGAKRSQVLRAVLSLALTTGVSGGVLGTAAGTASAAVFIRSGAIDGLNGHDLTVRWTSLALAVGVTALVSLLACLHPARRAARVSPLLALTGTIADDRSLSRSRRATAAVGAVVAIAGGACVWFASTSGAIELTAAGAVIMVTGLIVTLPLLVIGAAGLIGLLSGSKRHPVAHLACRNLGRNPGRAASTTAALLVCVSVAATMATGLAGMDGTMTSYLSAGSPIDITVRTVAPDAHAQGLVDQVEAVDGVEAAVLVPSPTLELSTEDGSERQGETITVTAIDQAAVGPIIRSHHGLEGLNDDTLVVGGIYLLPEGGRVTLTGPAGSRSFTVHVEEGGFGPVITSAAASELIGDGPTDSALWARTSGDGSDSITATATIREMLKGSGMIVSSSAQGRQYMSAQIQRTTAVVAAILGLTMLIALSGLANTTEVSVLERIREIGVMRATGGARRQIRLLFLTEATLTAVLGGVLGLVVGTVIGMAGLRALIGPDSGASPTLVVPWIQLAVVLAVSAGIGVLAALRPAGRAAAVAPVTALATD